jgi:gluconate 5-dehydrogenase
LEVQKNEKFIKALKSKTCLGRIGKPEDLGGAFVFLASDASDFITGHNLVIDGGWTIK